MKQAVIVIVVSLVVGLAVLAFRYALMKMIRKRVQDKESLESSVTLQAVDQITNAVSQFGNAIAGAIA